jgi:hypothetical protein
MISNNINISNVPSPYPPNLTTPNLTTPNLKGPYPPTPNLKGPYPPYSPNLKGSYPPNPNLKGPYPPNLKGPYPPNLKGPYPPNPNLKGPYPPNPNLKGPYPPNLKGPYPPYPPNLKGPYQLNPPNLKSNNLKKPKTDKYDYVANIDDDIADIIIPLIVLIFLIIFLIFIISVLSYSNFEVTTPENPVISDKRGTLTKNCKIGECATNILNGYKFCSDDESKPVKYNPSIEICNKKYECNSSITPYAVSADGSTNITGKCDENVACSCINNPQCPNYILSTFTTINGSLLRSIQNQRIIFPQVNSNTNNGIITTSSPIQLQNPVLQFCSAPLSYLQYATPGCNASLANDSNSLKYKDLVNCMGMEKKCAGTIYEKTDYKGSPCLQGTLAIITDNPDTLVQSDVNSFLLGCVQGETCPCGQVGVYNTNFGALQCLVIPE